jgi:hypothetical protein
MGQRTPWNYRQGFHATGYGRNKAKAGPFIPPQDYTKGLGSAGFRPSTMPMWNNKTAFGDWQGALDANDPRKKYRYSEELFDDDQIPDGVIRDPQGNVMGVNGYRLNKPVWGKNVNWFNKATGKTENKYEHRYREQKAFNQNEGVDSLKDIRRKLEFEVKGYIDSQYPKVPGQKSAPERKVNRKGIASYLIGHPQIGGGATMDEQFLTTHDLQGKDWHSALGSFHNSTEYRTALYNNLSDAIANRKAAVAEAAEQYIQAHK